MQSDAWIITPFNTVFLLTSGAFLLLLIVASLLLRGKSYRIKNTVLVCACVLTLIGFVFYKIFLSRDSSFNEITANMGGFNWWGELPLQLCNINMLLIPIAVLKKSRPMMSFCFFIGPLGALMALIMPGNGFDGYSLLLPRMLGYYGTHFMVFIEGLAIVTFGLYRPKFRDLPGTLLTILIVSFVIFLFSMVLRWTGLHPKANYFFSVETEGNFLLEIFHSWIPLPYLYLLPSILILLPYMLLVTTPFALSDRSRRKNNPRPYKDCKPV
ncbi:MAG: YwaF family protein [Oscillospiraceae bacterium]|nr:YwaF family protein [Oscillospiraceae bacterium]